MNYIKRNNPERQKTGRSRTRFLSILLMALIMACCAVPSGMPGMSGYSVYAAETTTRTKLIAFSYDDGPSFATEDLLDGLRERGAYATFFMTGHLEDGNHGLEYHPDLADRMISEGHQLANHSYYHINMEKATAEEVKTQIDHLEKILFKHMGGEYIDMFRPPHGQISAKQRKALDVPVILWNYDSYDWLNNNADTIYKNLVKGASDGAIIDIHDLSPNSVEGSLRAIDTLKEQGYEFVTVAELLRRRGITPKSGQIYSSAPNKGVNLPAYTAPTINCVRDYTAETTEVTFSTSDKGLTLYYTTDGSYPTLASKEYYGPFEISADTTFTVVGYDAWATRTPAAEQTVISRQTAVPEALEENGRITLSCETEAAVMYYTTDGSEPTTDSVRYTGPFRANGNTLKIIAARPDLRSSETAVYTVTDNGALFNDLDISLWYFPYVNSAVSQKIMNGMGEQKFAPQSKLNRAMMVQILYNMEGRPDYRVKNDTENDSGSGTVDDPQTDPDKFSFLDVSESNWFYDAVRWACSEGIVTGYSETEFAPRENITREQMVTMLNRYAGITGHPVAEETADLSSFPDAVNIHDYAKEAVSRAVAGGLLKGYEDGSLKPRSSVTRAEAAAVLTRYNGTEQ